MKLMLHNMLTCNVKGVKNGYPLQIDAETVEEREVDFSPEFLKNIYPKVDWAVLRDAAIGLGKGPLPKEVTDEMLEDETFLKTFHNVLLEVQVEEGSLICPESGRKFPINKGIPNMLLNEDEV
mmetsp:Transcript_52209/g.166296  ORF Transcript_52209/g.166296 Transcript_52209/m.166296 type:complete len:123 (-) Transcript_52209:126-494(-)